MTAETQQDTQPSQDDRIARLKALLTGGSAGTRTAAVASDGWGHLLLGVALHGANAQGSRALTDLEQMMVEALATVVEPEELRQWGAAYRETVTGAAPGTLAVPEVIAGRPATSGFAIADLQPVLGQLMQEAHDAPNVSLATVEDLAEGRNGECEEFLEAMRERGFAVTGVARHCRPETGASDAKPWRVRLEMHSFYVVRAVGDQFNSRDEIYWTGSASVGNGAGQTYKTGEYGGSETGMTHRFRDADRVLLDQQTTGDYAVASLQVWEADQSSSAWYSKLQQVLNKAVEEIDRALEHPMMNIMDPIPKEVALAYEVAKLFISLMDTFRNKDDLSCNRTFVLTREDMAVLHHRPEMEWDFNGDGHHKLRLLYTGEIPTYMTGSVEIVSRPQGPTPDDAGAWSAPIPLGWRAAATPGLTAHRGDLHTVFPRPGDHQLMWSRYRGGAWSTPVEIAGARSERPVALLSHKGRLHCLFTGTDSRVNAGWSDGERWASSAPISGWSSPYGPSLAVIDGALWSAHVRDGRVHAAPYNEASNRWGEAQQFGSPSTEFAAHSAPALSAAGGRPSGEHLSFNGRIVSWNHELAMHVRDWQTTKAPTVHQAGAYEWLAHQGLDGYPWVTWRRPSDIVALWKHPAAAIRDSVWSCPSLAAPVLTTRNDRLYAIYYAKSGTGAS
ncbi:hypothetical protein ACFY5K_36425 [Streptomyces griseofuscus]|uniref:hypothetical protein n=1 Tax=Streptomyces griseofuscus TaxID=146922 RepID=UPI0036C7C069